MASSASLLSGAGRRLRILHIVLSIGETNATYNEHCLPMVAQRDISLCTYFSSSVTPPPTLALFAGDGTLAGFFRALKAALKAKEYDVIHAHSPHVGLLYLMLTRPGYLSCATPAVMTVHDSFPNYKLRNKLLLLPVFAMFERVICCSQASFQSFPSLYKRLAGDRLGVVQNGMDIARVDRHATPTRQLPSPHPFRIVSISRLVAVKNPQTVLVAFQQAAESSHLTFIGDGPFRDSLKLATQAARLEADVEFTGLIPREQVYERLFSSDLFISASRGEGLPISVLEAMACGCPVLLSDIAPHREIARGCEFVPLVDPEDPPGFARQIRRFREMPPAERIAIGAACRKLVETQFSLGAMHAGYEAIYTDLGASRSRLSLGGLAL